MPSELEQLERDAAEMSTKREAVERRRSDLMDQIAAAKQGKIASSAPSVGTGRVYRATRQVLHVLDVSRARRVTLQPGMRVASISVNAQQFPSGEVIFISPETETTLVADGSITVAQ